MSEDDLALQNIGKLEPASIHIDLETQSRVSIDPVIVDEYAEAMLRGDTFAAVISKMNFFPDKFFVTHDTQTLSRSRHLRRVRVFTHKNDEPVHRGPDRLWQKPSHCDDLS